MTNMSDATLQVVLKRLEQQKLRSFDTETSGLDWRANHIVGYVLAFSGDPRDSYYVPFRHVGNSNVGGRPGPATATGWDGSPAPGELELIDAIDQQGALNFGHNLHFDLRFCWRAGMRKLQARWEDTIINAPLLDEFQPFFSLEYCCKQAGVAAKKSQQIIAYIASKFPGEVDADARVGPKAAMGHFWRLPGDDPMAVEYATGDGTSTWQLRDWQMQQIRKPLDIPEEEFLLTPVHQRTLEAVHDIESRLIPVLARMSAVGIRIDEERLEYLLSEKEGSVEYQLNKLKEEFPDGFNMRSPNDVQAWCVKHDITNWPLTPKGKPSFVKDWLETHEPGKKVVMLRKLATLRDSFLRPMKETHLWNGRVHATYHQLRGDEYGTVTGRLACTDPNLMAVSKHDWTIGALHRSIFIPDEGKRWSNADYSQIEPRLLAYYGDIEILLNGFNAVPYVDAHTSVSMMMRRDWDTMTKDERKQYRDNFGKRINQTVITGGGKNVLVRKYGVPQREVDAAWKAYHKAMPELKPLQAQSARKLRTRGYVLSLLGRQARLGPDGRDYVAVNRLLQVGNADIIKTKLVQIDEFLSSEAKDGVRPVDLLNTIHDDLAFQFDEPNRPVYDACIKMMTDFGPGQPIQLDIPMAVDVGEGSNWAEATYSK